MQVSVSPPVSAPLLILSPSLCLSLLPLHLLCLLHLLLLLLRVLLFLRAWSFYFWFKWRFAPRTSETTFSLLGRATFTAQQIEAELRDKEVQSGITARAEAMVKPSGGLCSRLPVLILMAQIPIAPMICRKSSPARSLGARRRAHTADRVPEGKSASEIRIQNTILCSGT